MLFRNAFKVLKRPFTFREVNPDCKYLKCYREVINFFIRSISDRNQPNDLLCKKATKY